MVKKQAKKKKASGVLALAMACMIMLSVVLVLTGAEVVEAEEVLRSSSEIRTPAEWETTESVLIVRNDDIYEDFHDHLVSTINNTSGSGTIINATSVAGSNPNISVRDYGPKTAMTSDGQRIYIGTEPVDPTENQNFPHNVLGLLPSYSAFQNYNGVYFNDGGDFMVCSGGISYESGQTTNINMVRYPLLYPDEDAVASKAEEIFGFHSHNIAGGSVFGGHIDMSVKLVSEDTVIIAERVDPSIPGYEPITNVQWESLNNTYDYFNNAKTRSGQPYNIVRVPIFRDSEFAGLRLIAYTNSLIVNDHIYIPEYDTALNDWNTEAWIAYQGLGYSVVRVTMHPIYTGAIHCATMQIPKENAAPNIQDLHVNIAETNGEYDVTISVDIVDDGEIEYADLYYYCSVYDEWKDVPLTQQGTSDTYQNTIEGITESQLLELEFFVRAEDDDRAVTYYGDAFEPISLSPQDFAHVDIYYPSQGQHVYGPQVTVAWDSDTPQIFISHFEIRRRSGPFIWPWINKGTSTYHMMFLDDGQYTFDVRVTTIDDGWDMDTVTFYVYSGGGGITSIDLIDARDDSVTVEWSCDNRYEVELDYYEIRLNNGRWLNVGTDTQYTFSDLEMGTHVVTVRYNNGDIMKDVAEGFVIRGPS